MNMLRQQTDTVTASVTRSGRRAVTAFAVGVVMGLNESGAERARQSTNSAPKLHAGG
jgi:hypothetical protein